MEDRAFNKMLLWLAAAAVVEVVMALLNRYYVHTRVSELAIKAPLYTILTIFPIAGVILFVLFLFLAHKVRKEDNGKDGTMQVILAFAFLCMGVGWLFDPEPGGHRCTSGSGSGPWVGRSDDGVLPVSERVFLPGAFTGGMCLLGLCCTGFSWRHGLLWLPDPNAGGGCSRPCPGPVTEREGRGSEGWRKGCRPPPARCGLLNLLSYGSDHGGPSAGSVGSGHCGGLLCHLGLWRRGCLSWLSILLQN